MQQPLMPSLNTFTSSMVASDNDARVSTYTLPTKGTESSGDKKRTETSGELRNHFIPGMLYEVKFYFHLN